MSSTCAQRSDAAAASTRWPRSCSRPSPTSRSATAWPWAASPRSARCSRSEADALAPRRKPARVAGFPPRRELTPALVRTDRGCPSKSKLGRRPPGCVVEGAHQFRPEDRKSTRLNSSHVKISYAVFCLKKKKKKNKSKREEEKKKNEQKKKK